MHTLYHAPKKYPIYTAEQIKMWESRWFLAGNSSFGLMQQAAMMMSEKITNFINHQQLSNPKILVWCGVGNNGGDGYLIASYLKQQNHWVEIYAPFDAKSQDCQTARAFAEKLGVSIQNNTVNDGFDVHIDALFGNGLNQPLDDTYQQVIQNFNQQSGIKIAIDIPSGLHPDTAVPMPICIHADFTLCVMGLKLGLLIGQGKTYAGKTVLIPLIPKDEQLTSIATIDTCYPDIVPRANHAHKGDFGHLLIIGGHQNMGGAALMAGVTAMACGVGKVTVMCHKNHHSAILAHSPNLMVKDMNDIFDRQSFADYLLDIDGVVFGMGLGRDTWSKQVYQSMITMIYQSYSLKTVIFDADALYFLAKHPQKLPDFIILTPHDGEAARLLNTKAPAINQDRLFSLQALSQKFGGTWVLKGAGSLVCDKGEIGVCAFGNPAMATAGMGDVLAGLIGGLKLSQPQLSLLDMISIHALAGDYLANKTKIGLEAVQMLKAITKILNQKFS